MLKDSVLILPRRMCAECGSDRLWQDFRGNPRCMNCEPPHKVLREVRNEKRERAAINRAVDLEVQRAIEDEARGGASIPKHWS